MNSEESILIRVGIICGIDEEFWNMFLSDYLEIGDSLENIGVFDPVLDKDKGQCLFYQYSEIEGNNYARIPRFL